MKIKVTASPDNMGNIELCPLSMKHRIAYAKHIKEMTGHADPSVFLQEGQAADEFLSDLSPRQRRDLDAGFDVTFLIDPWIYGNYLGYDACEVNL